MEKTTVYLPVELKTALRRVALRRGVSEAAIIRESLQPGRGWGGPSAAAGRPHRLGRHDRAHRGRGAARVWRAVIVDTSVLLAYFNRLEPDHVAAVSAIDATIEPLVVSPFVIAELDYLAATRLGVEAEIALLTELAGGAWELPAFGADDLAMARDVIERYADQAIGVADASIVVLAARFGTRTVATLDRRHFEVLRPLGGGRFSIVP